MKLVCLLLLLTGAWICAPRSVRADTLVLTDGRILERVRVAPQSSSYVVVFEHGRITLPKETVHAHFQEGDPAVAVSLKARRPHSERHGLRQYESSYFRYRTSLSELAFAQYREAMERHVSTLQAAFGLADVAHPDATALILAERDEFWMYGGGRHAECYFHRREPKELALYDDRTKRSVSLRMARWGVAAYVLDRAYPQLGSASFLRVALADYCASATKDPGGSGLLTGLTCGRMWESMRRKRAVRGTVSLSRVTHGSEESRRAWSWALVHYLLDSDAHAAAFRRFLPTASGTSSEDLTALSKALGLDEPDTLSAFLRSWKTHLDALAPTTGVDFLLAAEVALNRRQYVRANCLYNEATRLPGGGLAGRIGLAEVARRRGSPHAEIDALSRVLDLDPLDVDARRKRASVLRSLGSGASVEREEALATEIAASLSARPH